MTTLKPPKYWYSEPPDRCDIGGEPITDVFIDGGTIQGPWANMCPKCHLTYGIGIGLGRGQRYEKEGDRWVKTEG